MTTTEKATLGAGCFWCVEAVFQSLRGVKEVSSGYSGGPKENPSYQQVCSGTSGHAEVVQVSFDPSIITFRQLLEVFWRTHDPTTLNRQGADAGTQYRSVIFYHSDEQRQIAEESKRETDSSGLWPDSIVTEIAAFDNFFAAEHYHQDYYKLNGNQPYCRVIIDPKIRKLRQDFADLLAD